MQARFRYYRPAIHIAQFVGSRERLRLATNQMSDALAEKIADDIIAGD